jgi:hypothetical protein
MSPAITPDALRDAYVQRPIVVASATPQASGYSFLEY